MVFHRPQRCIGVATALLLLPALAMAQQAAPSADPACTLFDPTPDAALRSFNTDRPTKSIVPTTVDCGHFQYETDLVNVQHTNAGGVSMRLVTVADPVLKLGVTNNAEVELQFGGYNWLDVSPHGQGQSQHVSAAGAGDLTVRTKVNIFGNDGGAAAAFIPYVKIPTAGRMIGNGHVDGGLILPISLPLPLGFTVLVMPEIDILENASTDGHHFDYAQLLNVSHPVGADLTLYGEIYSALGTDAHTPPVYTLDVAAEYLLTKTLQVDFGTNIGLNRAAPNIQVYTGVAQRF